jgi:hypothetical protein
VLPVMEVEDDPREMGWAEMGFGEERRGHKRPKRRKDLFFSKVFSYFCFPNRFCYFGNNLRIQNFLKYFRVTMDLLYI